MSTSSVLGVRWCAQKDMDLGQQEHEYQNRIRVQKELITEDGKISIRDYEKILRGRISFN